MFLALSSGMAFAAFCSFLLLRYTAPNGINLEAVPSKLRLLKREQAHISLRISGNSRWITLASAIPQKSSSLTLRRELGRSFGEFAVDADYAGRHERVELSVSFEDVLGLFRRAERVGLENFVVEVLPLSILTSPESSIIFAMTSGETPAGSRGSGQEFYGIEGYAGLRDSKDILWKRVAKTPHEAIVSRVREANVPQSFKVCLIESWNGDRTFWMDAVTEVLGKIGVSLLGIGVRLEVCLPTHDGGHILSAKNMDELVDLVMDMWKQKGVPELVTNTALDADLIVASSGALSTREVFGLSESMPTLVVLDSGVPPALGQRSRVLSETFELEGLISWVIVR